MPLRSRRLALVLGACALTGLVIAGIVASSRMRWGEPPALTEEFARTTGFARPVDTIKLVPALPSRWFAGAESFVPWQRDMREKLAAVFQRPVSPQPVPIVLDRARLPAPAGLVRERLQFVAGDGAHIPAILQYPAGAGTYPALLVIPGHVPGNDSGLRQLVDAPESYQRAAATALAQRGFVTLALELRGFGLLGRALGAEHNAIAFNMLQRGSFYKARVLDDASRAIALLRALPQVDVSRIGVTGASMGGELAVAVAALDESIAAVASAAYGGNAGLLPGRDGLDEVVIHYCHVIPGAWTFLRQEDMVLLLAPRPTLIVRGGDEYQYDELFGTSAAAAWRSLGARERFELKIVPKGGDEFFVQEIAEFFGRALAGGRAADR